MEIIQIDNCENCNKSNVCKYKTSLKNELTTTFKERFEGTAIYKYPLSITIACKEYDLSSCLPKRR